MPIFKSINIPTDVQQEEWEQKVLIPENISGIERQLKQSAQETIKSLKRIEELDKKIAEKFGKKIKELKPKEQKDKTTSYYMYAVNSKKAILLANTTKSSDVLKDLTLEKLKNKLDKLHGVYVYKITIKNVSTDSEQHSKVKMIGGPVAAKIERYEITPNNKLKNLDSDSNNLIYFSIDYMDKHKEVKEKDVAKLIFDYAHGKTNKSLFAVNTIEPTKQPSKPKEEEDAFKKFLSSKKLSENQIEKWLLKNHYDPSKDTDLHKKQDERTKLIKMRDDAKAILEIIEREENKM